ncbi:hypothetical protein NM688_g4297 [Phlebia brevispora]|uniref:Uncharacterized protein n=1 Tax=Phlebia brevispora TaxID=194682 RepID=A0ACC1T3J4_9APHY|nr:hypothetical protein NM688_g4297 [Phlebia brevispora]
MDAIRGLSEDILEQVDATNEAFAPLWKLHEEEILSIRRRTFKYGATDRHQLDIYYPSAKGTVDAPILIFVYGGGYLNGAKVLEPPFDLKYKNAGAFFAKQGFVTVIADYRLFPQIKFPDPAIDVRDALAWLVRHVDTVNRDVDVKADVSRIFLMGHSAGATTVATLMLAPGVLPTNLRQRILSVVLNAGVYDFRDTPALPLTVVRGYFGATEAEVRKTEPLGLLENASRDILTDFPPVYALIAEHDYPPIVMSHRKFVSALKERMKSSVEELVLTGHNHVSSNNSLFSGLAEAYFARATLQTLYLDLGTWIVDLSLLAVGLCKQVSSTKLNASLQRSSLHPLDVLLLLLVCNTLVLMSSWRSHNRFTGSSRTPTFQPPSFYAAAAGVPYSSSPVVNGPGQSSSTMFPSSPAADADSDSARDPVSSTGARPRRRSVSLSRALLPGSVRQDKDKAKHQYNKSQIVDIPFLETSLLPSLRDTIDKMTHPPRTEVQDPSDIASHPYEHPEYAPSPGASSRANTSLLNTDPYRNAGRSPVLPSYSSNPSENARAGPSGLRTPQVTTPKTAYSAPRVSANRMGRESPVVNPNAAVSNAPRSATKSSHLTSQAPSSVPTAHAASPNPGRSLRSVKSMFSPSQPSPKIKSPSAPRPGDDTILLRPETTALTPRNKHKPVTSTSKLSPSQQAPPLRSHIPVPSRAGDSGSELEREYGRSIASGKLVVANAVVEPSSSDSESQRAGGISQSRLRTPKDLRSGLLERIGRSPRGGQSSPLLRHSPNMRQHREDPSKPSRTIGLGLSLYAEQHRRSFHEPEYDDDRSVYEDEDEMNPPQDYHQTHGHGTEYTDDEASVYDESDIEPDPRHIGLRQQQALMGLVDGLHMDFGLHTEKSRLSNSDSDGHYYVEGVAISGSTDFVDEQRFDDSISHRYRGSQERQDSRRSSRTKDRKEPIPHQPLSYPPSSRSSYPGESLPSKLEAKRERTHPTQPTPRPPSRQDLSTRERDTIQAEQEARTSASRASSDKSKSRHRVSVSLGRLTDKTRDSSNEARQAKTRRSSSHQRDSKGDSRRNSKHISGEPKAGGHRSSDAIMREREGFGIPASLSYGGKLCAIGKRE